MRDCDFIPASHHVRLKQHSMMRMRATFLSVMVGIMVIWVTAHHHDLTSAEAMLVDVSTQRVQVEALLRKKADMEKERETLAARKRLIERLEQNANMVILMSDVSRRMPETVVLTKLNMRAPGLSQFGLSEAPPKPKVNDSQVSPAAAAAAAAAATALPPVRPAVIEMIGIANESSEIIRFAAALEQSPLFARVSMQVKGQVDWASRRAEQFEMTCELAEQTGAHP